MKMIQKKLINIFNIAFAGIFYYIWILAVGKMNLQSPMSALLILPFFYLLYRIIKCERICHISKMAKSWWILQVVSFVIMLIMAYQLRVMATWDWGRLLLTAYNYTMTGELDYPEYFMRHPNNQFWLVCLIAFFNMIHILTSDVDFYVYKGISMIMGVLLVQIAILFIYKTAKLIWDEKRALLVGIFALLYVPFYLYAMYLYSDTPGLCIASLLIYCTTKLQKKQRSGQKSFFTIGIISILASLACYVKLFVFIIFVAIIVIGLLKNNIKSMIISIGVSAVFFGISYILIGNLTASCLQFDEQEAKCYEFPPTHWIMMALNTTGGFNQEDVDFSISYDTYDKKKEANIIKIKERLANMGVDGTVKHILYTKQIRTWADSCLGGDNYVSRKPIWEHSPCQEIFSINGKLHWLCLIYTWMIHITILTGLVLSAILSVRENVTKQKLLMERIAILGLFLFLSIWECNPRYLFTMIPAMILVASDGLFLASEKLRVCRFSRI